MNEELKKQDPTLVCTCSDLYINDIEDAIAEGEGEYTEILQYHCTFPRCGQCKEHVEEIIEQVSVTDRT